MSNNQDYDSLQKDFNSLSLKEKDKKKERPLKNSTYNIFEAYNDNIPVDFSLILDCQSIHPLQSANPYGFDLNHKPVPSNEDSDIKELIETLDLNDKAPRSSSMPYCA